MQLPRRTILLPQGQNCLLQDQERQAQNARPRRTSLFLRPSAKHSAVAGDRSPRKSSGDWWPMRSLAACSSRPA